MQIFDLFFQQLLHFRVSEGYQQTYQEHFKLVQLWQEVETLPLLLELLHEQLPLYQGAEQ